MYTAISLFSGFGLMDEAFFLEGFAMRAQVEKIAWRRQVLSRRFPRSKIFEDVHDVGRHNLPANPTVIFGGFPCQPVSGAGKRKGTEDDRWLWPEFARIVSELRPRVVFLENADEICAPVRDPETKEIKATAPAFEVLASLTALGYDAQWGIVPAAAAGAPHERLRWWCVAWRISDTDQDQCGAGICIDEQRRQTAVDDASGSAIAHTKAKGLRQTISCRNESQIAISPSDDQGVALGDTRRVRLARSDSIAVSTSTKVATDFSSGTSVRHAQRSRLEGQAGEELEVAAQSEQGLGCESIQSSDEPDLGRSVFDGLSCRLERLASTQLWAAPLGLQPYSFEPDRLIDDNYDWKDRVEAIGDSVCLPVVRAFAAGIREALRTQDAAVRERARNEV